jgi:hypothetical protein
MRPAAVQPPATKAGAGASGKLTAIQKRKRTPAVPSNQSQLTRPGTTGTSWLTTPKTTTNAAKLEPGTTNADLSAMQSLPQIANTKADVDRLRATGNDLAECMRQHDIVLQKVKSAAQQPENPAERIALLKQLTEEFAEANRPLLDLSIYQRELSSTLDFSGGADPRAISAQKLHEIPLEMELDFMREANTANGERPCRSGAQCDTFRVAKRLGKKGWIMREFLMPPDQEQLKVANELPTQAQMCVFCNKKNTFMHYATPLYLNTDAKVIIQPYRNICDVPGEFDSRLCIKPRPDRFFGIVAPFARHDTNMYTMEIDPETNTPFAAFTDAVYFRPPPAAHD